MTATPSKYELEQWRAMGRHKGRTMTRALEATTKGVTTGLAALGESADELIDKVPGGKRVLARAQGGVAKAAGAVKSGAAKVGEVLPETGGVWVGSALDSVRGAGARISRAGLTSAQVVKKHKKHGHAVDDLADIRTLDLKQVHAVRGSFMKWSYPASAALSGAGAGLVISGGQFVTVASAGAAAAPSAGVVIGTLAADAAAVLALSSRAVGQVALAYGYDPEDAGEKMFILSVVNLGTAVSAGAKTAAFADVSRLTQALVRGKTWDVLNQSVVARASAQLTKAFGARFTKKTLGKVLPAVGILLGGAFNWTTLESIVDAADLAYQRRFLLEKYPGLADEEPVELRVVTDGTDDADDEVISVLDELREAGADLT